MKIKEVSGYAGYYIEIEPGGEVYGADNVCLHTCNSAPFKSHDELWVLKRKRFLKAVSKALDVTIFERENADDIIGYYK